MTEKPAQKLIGEMDEAEFVALIEQFIERETQSGGEAPPDVLFAALPDFFAAEPIQQVEVAVNGELQGDRLVLSIPAELPSQVHEIEVRFPAIRVVVSMSPQMTPVSH